MKIAVIICRILLGAGFITFGLNILHPFLPMPPMDPLSFSGRFGSVMAESNWFKLIGAFQLFGGIFVIIGRTAPIGLVLLGPILVNVIAFHVFLEKGAGMAPGLVFCALELFLIYAYRKYFMSIFTIDAKI